MKKLGATATLILLVAAPFAVAAAVSGARPLALKRASGTVWVVERGLNTVTAFDAATGMPVKTWPTGVRPIGVTAPRDTDKVYTADERSNQMTVISKETLEVVKTIPMGVWPHHVMASPNGKRVYVGEFGSNQVGVVDTASDTRVAGFAASPDAGARTHAVWITNNGKDLYATNEVTNDIAKIDARTGTLLWNLPVGNRPSEILVTDDGRTAYVTVRNEDKVKVVDLTTAPARIVAETFIGTQPDTMQLTKTGTLVVGLRGVPARMALMDTATLAVRWVDLPGHVTTGHQWLSAGDRYTFIAVETPGAVAVVDNEKGELVREFPYPGGPLPHGVYFEHEEVR
jgi:YVTN family beta-propeller protein